MGKTWMIIVGILFLLLPTAAQEPETLTIFGASSLTSAFTEIAEAFESNHPETDILLNFAGSSTLATQIIEGAPADIFASANEQQMQSLIDEDLADTMTIFAYNQLVIIVPADNPANITSAEDLANEGVLLVLAAPAVPAREYSAQLLDNLSGVYGETYPDDVYRNLVSEEANVRRVAARVALGEADAGIVYRTDVTPDIADSVQIIDVPANTSPLAVYPIVAISDNPLAAEFIRFVQSETGITILNEWGFCTQLNMPEATPEPDDINSEDDNHAVRCDA